MSDCIKRDRYLIDGHRASDRDNDDGVACGCRADGLRDHSRHVAEQIVERLGLKPESVREVVNELVNETRRNCRDSVRRGAMAGMGD